MSACRSCAHPIRFVESRTTGKRMPVDPELIRTFVDPAAKVGKRIQLVTEDGKMVGGIECSVTNQGSTAIEGYMPHWATCSDPARWRQDHARRG